ncbi:YSIRK-type signal peptide-containing protein, partial [Gemella haemolysans]|uniref:YSIRK-type signal peptide-containing protein n=1 Tax=Gemella haemolysans TaxID=1379 RepID=UPI00195A8C7F
MENRDKNKVLKYSIKKFSVGTFSVLVGAFIFLATPALASETNSENIHKENSTIIEKEKPKENYKNEVNIANETSNVEKNVSNNAKENNSPEKQSNLIEEKNSIDAAGLESGEKNYSTEKNADSIDEKSSMDKTVAGKPKSRGKRSIDSERESAKRFATDDDFEKISKGLITTEDGKIDNLLFGKTPLKANEDKDGDTAKNGREIYIYEKDGKTYYGYYGHPFLKDTDGDGLIDHDQSDLSKSGDDDNFKWYVTDRDMAMFMKLAYRDDEYIKKVLNKDYKWTAADNNVKDDEKAKNVYELMHNELAGYWEIDKTYHNASGLDAVLFKTKSVLPILPDGLVHVLAIRGTKGGADVTNDGVIAAGQDPKQGKEIEEIIKEIGIREDIKNFYITGHSLGGYLTQRAVVKLNRLANEENGYWIDSAAKKYRNFYNNVFKKATTFNAPKINASRTNGDLYKKSILSKELAKQGKIKHYGMRGDSFVGLLYNDKDVMTYIEGGEHSSNAYFSAMLNDDDNFNIGERTGVSGKGKENLILKNLKIVEPTDEEVRKIVNENIKISLKDQNPVEILALNKISREEVLKKLNLDNLPNTATLNINIPNEIQPTAVNYVLPVTISYLGKTVNPNINVVVKVLPNFEELKVVKQKASDEKEKKVDTEHKTTETKNRYDAKKVELDTKLQKVEELLKNSTAKQSDIKALTQELERLLEEYKTSVSDLKLDKTLLTDEIARVTNSLETFENTNTTLKPSEVVTEFNSQKNELLNKYNSLLKEVKGNLDGIETYDKLVEEKNKFANLEKEISKASSILNKTQKDYYEPTKKSYELYEGDEANAELSIEKNNLPIKNIIWETEPNTSSSGNKEGRAKVVYNDDSFDLIDVNVNVKALYGEIVTTTEEEKLPLKVTYTGDDTKDYGYISETTGKDGKVVTTIKSRLNKKTNTVEEINRISARTEAVNTVITKGIKTKIKETTIPREVVYEEDASVEKGKDVVKREGEDGKNITTTTYILNSKTGEITEKVTVEKKEKTDKIIARGTKEVASEPEIIEVPADPKINPNEDSTSVEPEETGNQGNSTKPVEEKPKEETPADSEKPERPVKPVQPGESGNQGNSTKPVEEKPKEETPADSEKPE